MAIDDLLRRDDIPEDAKPEIAEAAKALRLLAALLSAAPGLIHLDDGDPRVDHAAAQALLDSHERHRVLFEKMSQGVVYQDAQGRVTMANPAAESILGLTLDEMRGRTSMDPRWRAIREDGSELPGHEHPAMIALRTGREVGPITFGVHNPRDGEHRWLSVGAVPCYRPGERMPFEVFATFTDITERVRAEAAIRDSERLLRESQEAARIGSYIQDTVSGNWVSSPVLDSIFGIDEHYPKTVDSWAGLLHPECRDEMMEYLERIQSERSRFDKTYRIIRADNGEERWLHGLGELEYDTEDRLVRMVGTVRDITESVRAEEERARLERQVQHAQKLESLGVLAGGIAHDFSNILMGVLGNAGLALTHLPVGAPARQCVQQIETAALRAADLARQMLAYSGKGRFIVERLDLAELVDEMSHLLESSLSKKAVLRRDLERGVAIVEGDATQLRQVIMNLITNAAEAVGDEPGMVTVSAHIAEANAGTFDGTYVDDSLPPGRYSVLEVSDTGCGMDPETQARIFDPFFSTKRAGRGLGMAAVLGIVRGHGGAIKVYSEAERGTSMKVFLPLAEGPAPASEAAGQHRTEPSVPAETGAVLVVDDEETVRHVVELTLQRAGYTVILAEDGERAVEVFAECADRIVAVVLDVSMPRMSGEEAFLALKRIRPDVPILLSSGFDEQESTVRLAGRDLAGFIQKPYHPAQLLAQLRKVTQPG